MAAPDNEHMKALELALRVVGATRTLNEVVEEAYKAGLVAQITTLPVQAVGTRRRDLIMVEVSQPLAKS